MTKTINWTSALLSALSMVVRAAAAAGDEESHVGTAVIGPQAEAQWWQTVNGVDREALADLFEPTWFESLPEPQRISYSYVAHTLFEFVNSGADSHPHDFYVGFAPLLLRASFHAAGSFHAPSGTGGSNGGTIFSAGELQDDQNACIDKATEALTNLYQGSKGVVSQADAMVIAGSVALQSMGFPRMDLLRITGGRKDVSGVAYRERLPNPDFNPLALFQESYQLTPSELTALIGGAHNFGSSHGVCTGYVGAWTSDPLAWASPTTGRSEFFVDLVKEDWRWYEVCTYKNGTSTFVSIEDPFVSGAIFEEHHEEEGGEEDICAMEQNASPFVCEEQAMRGCDFEDGSYGPTEPPCDPTLLHMRLKSDFFLKVDPELKPHTMRFMEDDELLAQEFGIAYHKLTHAGLYRCGLSGLDNNCGENGTCKDVLDSVTGEYLTSYCVFNGSGVAPNEKVDPSFTMSTDTMEEDWHLSKAGSIALLVILGMMLLVITLLAKTLYFLYHPQQKNHYASTPSAIVEKGNSTGAFTGEGPHSEEEVPTNSDDSNA